MECEDLESIKIANIRWWFDDGDDVEDDVIQRLTVWRPNCDYICAQSHTHTRTRARTRKYNNDCSYKTVGHSDCLFVCLENTEINRKKTKLNDMYQTGFWFSDAILLPFFAIRIALAMIDNYFDIQYYYTNRCFFFLSLFVCALRTYKWVYTRARLLCMCMACCASSHLFKESYRHTWETQESKTIQQMKKGEKKSRGKKHTHLGESKLNGLLPIQFSNIYCVERYI